MGSAPSCSRPRVAPAENFDNHGERTKAWATVDNSLSGSPTFLLKERIQCLCEGGSNCSRESPEAQTTPNAIPGLHSNWVTDDILAMARPWQESVEKYGLGKVFQEKSIGLILNLQEVGEHAHCGRGVLASTGFSYDPETFMAHGVGVCCMAWRDMGVPQLEHMMDIVQVMSHTGCTERRRIAVHCHAGLGRTGLAISCYLVFAKGYEPGDAIQLVRKERSGALQTRQQVEFVYTFQRYIAHLRCIFYGPKLEALEKAAGPKSPQANSDCVDPSAQSEIETSVDRKNGAKSRSRRLLEKIGIVSPSAQSQQEFGYTGTGSVSGKRSASETKARLVQSTLSGLSEVKLDRNYRRETYASGLQVIKPMPPNCGQLASRYHDRAKCSAAPSSLRSGAQPIGIVAESHGVQQKHPRVLNASVFTIENEPQPPRSMQEALARQKRLLHGSERRGLLFVHKVVVEVCDLVVSRAKSFAPPRADGAETPNVGFSFGDALVRCIRRHEALTDNDYGAELISPGTTDRMVACIKSDINAGNWGELRRSPTVAVVAILEEFLLSLESPSLSKDDLSVILVKIGSAYNEVATVGKHIRALSSEGQHLLRATVGMLRQVLRQQPPPADGIAEYLFAWAAACLLGEKSVDMATTGPQFCLRLFLSFLGNIEDWSGVLSPPVRWQEV